MFVNPVGPARSRPAPTKLCRAKWHAKRAPRLGVSSVIGQEHRAVMVLTHNAILEQVIEIQLDLYLADGFVSHYLYSLDDPLHCFAPPFKRISKKRGIPCYLLTELPTIGAGCRTGKPRP